ncbi:metal ABC transporter permease [Rickettsiales endosymbiont of Stachyamoeba lipophora]|uniref:metal ABC transporter permease n=1 Tax=Rickettsiales endosymbiont of Stachyamoeba lipophora TaxID=2486578 RepID=UPI000F64FA70|nr:metal ABC transporter permease [Rickettsiales endosymbiont of Stachyamoeba lipophora]AZL16231.1 metal ABC transporter permease [Rickettsiales endosymbiont of Stachyamoeba lipophora]
MSIILFPILINLLVSLLTAPIGCILIWKRISYFADYLAHSLMLAVALSILIDINLNYLLIIFSILISLIIISLKNQTYFKFDLIINVISPFFLALSLIILHFYPNNIDLSSYLFGDLLAVNNNDIITISMLTLVVYCWLFFNWNKLLLIVIDENIAASNGLNIHKFRLIYLTIISFTIAMIIKLVGILMITAILILPSAIARIITKNPFSMCVASYIINVTIATIAIIISYYSDLAITPITIVLLSCILFASLIAQKVKQIFHP